MRREVSGTHDALDRLYQAVTEGQNPSTSSNDMHTLSKPPNSDVEDPREVIRQEVYGPHDALDLLYKAALDRYGSSQLVTKPY